jgi:hypothetical protein
MEQLKVRMKAQLKVGMIDGGDDDDDDVDDASHSDYLDKKTAVALDNTTLVEADAETGMHVVSDGL